MKRSSDIVSPRKGISKKEKLWDFEAIAGDITSLVINTRRGKRRGEEITFLCPVHDDTNPSASWNPTKMTWHCFACGAGGGMLYLAGILGVAPPRRRQALRVTPAIRKEQRARAEAADERERVFDELRALWDRRDEITCDLQVGPLLFDMYLPELTDIADREVALAERFRLLTLRATGRDNE